MSFFKASLFFVVLSSLLLLTSCSNIDVQTLNMRAKQLMDSGDIDGAIGRLESINDLNPNYPQTQYNLGIAYYKKGVYDKAVNSLNAAIRLDKNFADAYYTLGVVYDDVAYSEIEKAKKDKSIENAEALNKIIAYLKSAKESFTQYIDLSKSTSDIENIKLRIENIDADIKKYETMLLNNSNSTKNQF